MENSKYLQIVPLLSQVYSRLVLFYFSSAYLITIPLAFIVFNSYKFKHKLNFQN